MKKVQYSGFCTPDDPFFKALLDRNPDPTEEDVKIAIAETSADVLVIKRYLKQSSQLQKNEMLKRSKY